MKLRKSYLWVAAALCMWMSVMSHAEIRHLAIESEYLSSAERVVVASPDTSAPADGWPTLYLLNGYKDNEEAWPKRMPLDSLANVYGVVIVCPDGRDSFYWDVDDSISPGLKMESFITRKLIPTVDSLYHISPASRTIAGYSMGGHGALYLTARHPELFSAAVSLSGAFDIDHIKAYPWIKVPSLLGPYDKKVWHGHSAFAFVDSLAVHRPAIMIVCGDKDAFLPDNKRMHAALESRGVEHVYKVLPGDHNWKFWRPRLCELLDFITTIPQK